MRINNFLQIIIQGISDCVHQLLPIGSLLHKGHEQRTQFGSGSLCHLGWSLTGPLQLLQSLAEAEFILVVVCHQTESFDGGSEIRAVLPSHRFQLRKRARRAVLQ